jgi:hypothetical protein
MAKPLTASQKAAVAAEKARQAAAAAKKNKPKPTPSAGRRVNPKAAKPKPPAAKPTRPALPPGRPGGPLAIRPKVGLGSRLAMGAAIVNQAMDVGRGFQKLANHPFINNRGKGGKPTPSAGRRTNPNAAKPKPKLADIRGTSKSKFADLRGSSKPGGSAPAAARELPKPTPKPKPSSATTPTRSSTPARPAASRPAASRPAATPAKAKPPAASKPTVAQTSGIGPVKSGTEYARKKGSLREQARKLREMQAESRKRQGK